MHKSAGMPADFFSGMKAAAVKERVAMAPDNSAHKDNILLQNRSNTRQVRQAGRAWVPYRPDRFADIPGRGMGKHRDKGRDNGMDRPGCSLPFRLSAQGRPNRLPSHAHASLRLCRAIRHDRHMPARWTAVRAIRPITFS